MDWMLLPIRRYAEFTGRSCRAEYWMFALLNLLAVAVFLLLFTLVGGFSSDSPGDIGAAGGVLLIIGALIYLALFFIPSIAVTIRRWHDLGQSGWFLLLFAVLGAIPFVGVIASIGNLVWFCLPGNPGANKYGDDPLA